MLNAAPGLYASVSRAYSPNTLRGKWSVSIAAASTFVMTSSTMTATAAVQNTRPFDAEAIRIRSGGFARVPAAERRRDRRRGLVIFHPEDPGEKDRTDTHGHVGDVEGRPAGVAQSHVDEIHDAEVGAQAIEQVAEGPAADEGQGHDAGRVALGGACIEPGENGERAQGEGDENPARLLAEVEAECRARVVYQVELHRVTEHFARQPGKPQPVHGHGFGDQIQRRHQG